MRLLLNVEDEQSIFDMAASVQQHTWQRAFNLLINLASNGAIMVRDMKQIKPLHIHEMSLKGENDEDHEHWRIHSVDGGWNFIIRRLFTLGT